MALAWVWGVTATAAGTTGEVASDIDSGLEVAAVREAADFTDPVWAALKQITETRASDKPAPANSHERGARNPWRAPPI